VSRYRAGDLVVLALGASFVGASYAAFWGDRTTGTEAAVFVDKEQVALLELAADGDHAVRGRIGNSILRVEGGRVRFTDSPCPGRICVHSGWLARSGEVAACLPNGVVVEVQGREREYDAVNR
jgi:hypothetical protein